MARYRGPTCKLARREGTDLFLKSGLKPLESKCKLEVPPAAPVSAGSGCPTTACSCARSRSCAACTACSSGSSATYYKKAAKVKGSTGENLLRMLEARLDNVVYRMGFASTRAEARQLVGHRGIEVNEQIVNIPSYQLKAGDKIAVRDRAKEQLRIKSALSIAAKSASRNGSRSTTRTCRAR